MERRIINPWTWQDQFGFVQANEVRGEQRTLICAGQTSVDADGGPVHVGDMAGQISQALDNLETVLREAGFKMSDVVRLNYYTTNVDSFLKHTGRWQSAVWQKLVVGLPAPSWVLQVSPSPNCSWRLKRRRCCRGGHSLCHLSSVRTLTVYKA